MEQSQRQRFLEFVNIIFLPPFWQHIHCHFWTAPGLGEAKRSPCFLPCKYQSCSHRATASVDAWWVVRVKGMWQIAQKWPGLLLSLTHAHVLQPDESVQWSQERQETKSLENYTSHSQHPEPDNVNAQRLIDQGACMDKSMAINRGEDSGILLIL